MPQLSMHAKCLKHLDAKIWEDENYTYVKQKSIEEDVWRRGFKPMGQGGFGAVYREDCIRGRNVGSVRAVKAIQKPTAAHVKDLDYGRELEAIAHFSSFEYRAFFVQSAGYYTNDEAIFLTMELIEHGDLQQYIGIGLPESEVLSLVAQILLGLQCMHESGYTHRDLKPKNLLVVSEGPSWHVKIADFGLSKKVVDSVSSLRTLHRGTMGYIAPEVLGLNEDEGDDSDDDNNNSYTNAVDIWAVGAIAFMLLTGELPFPTHDLRPLKRYVRRKKLFPDESLAVQKTSPAGRLFIRNLMSPNANDRPSAYESLQDRWFKDSLPNLHMMSMTSLSRHPTLRSIRTDEASATWTTIYTTRRINIPSTPNAMNEEINQSSLRDMSANDNDRFEETNETFLRGTDEKQPQLIANTLCEDRASTEQLHTVWSSASDLNSNAHKEEPKIVSQPEANGAGSMQDGEVVNEDEISKNRVDSTQGSEEHKYDVRNQLTELVHHHSAPESEACRKSPPALPHSSAAKFETSSITLADVDLVASSDLAEKADGRSGVTEMTDFHSQTTKVEAVHELQVTAPFDKDASETDSAHIRSQSGNLSPGSRHRHSAADTNTGRNVIHRTDWAMMPRAFPHVGKGQPNVNRSPVDAVHESQEDVKSFGNENERELSYLRSDSRPSSSSQTEESLSFVQMRQARVMDLELLEEEVWRMALTPDGQYLAVVTCWHTVNHSMLIVWEVDQKTEVLRYHFDTPGRSDWYTRVMFLPDGQHLVSVFTTDHVYLWETTRWTLKANLSKKLGTRIGIHDVGFSPDGRLLAAVKNGERPLLLWNLSTGRGLKTDEFKNNAVSSRNNSAITFSSKGHLVIAGDGKTTIWTMNYSSTEVIGVSLLNDIKRPVGQNTEYMMFSPDGRYLAESTHWPSAPVWLCETTSGSLPQTIAGTEGAKIGAFFSERLLALSYKKGISFWNVETLDRVADFRYDEQPELADYEYNAAIFDRHIAYSPSCNLIAVSFRGKVDWEARRVVTFHVIIEAASSPFDQTFSVSLEVDRTGDAAQLAEARVGSFLKGHSPSIAGSHKRGRFFKKFGEFEEKFKS